MNRFVKLAALLVVAASFACSNNPGGADGGSSTGSHGTTGSTGASTGGSQGSTGASSSTGGQGSTGASSGSTGSGSGTTGGSSGSTGGACASLPDSIPVDQLETTELAVLCDVTAQCIPQASYLESSCPTTDAAFIGPQLGELLADVDAGAVAYDPVAASNCYKALCAGGCAEIGVGVASPAACKAVFTGQVGNGAACYDTFSCDAGYCTSQTSSACPGSCAPYAGLGNACGGDGGAPCDPSATCAGSVCVALPGVGASCVQTGQCLQGLSCVGGSTCLGPGDAGAPCDGAFGSNECQGGLYCDLVDAGVGSCVPQLGSGAPCSGQGAALSALFGGECAQGLVCKGYSSVVTSSATTSTAGSCTAAADVGGSCVTPPADAGPGVFFAQYVTGCLTGLACVNGSCAVPPASGACAPDPNARCQSGVAYCDPTGTCQPPQPTGAACSIALSGADCQSGYCVPSPDGGFVTGICGSPSSTGCQAP